MKNVQGDVLTDKKLGDGEWLVVSTKMTGGGMVRPGDYHPNGHQIKLQKLLPDSDTIDPQHREVKFYQTGGFSSEYMLVNPTFVRNIQASKTNKINIKPIKWSGEFEPSEHCSYNHVKGVTPLGEFTITWKGWKDSPSYTIENTINDIYLNPGVSLDDAKETVWAFYRLTVRSCIDYEGAKLS